MLANEGEKKNIADAEAYVDDHRVVQLPSLALHHGLDRGVKVRLKNKT